MEPPKVPSFLTMPPEIRSQIYEDLFPMHVNFLFDVKSSDGKDAKGGEPTNAFTYYLANAPTKKLNINKQVDSEISSAYASLQEQIDTIITSNATKQDKHLLFIEDPTKKLLDLVRESRFIFAGTVSDTKSAISNIPKKVRENIKNVFLSRSLFDESISSNYNEWLNSDANNNSELTNILRKEFKLDTLALYSQAMGSYMIPTTYKAPVEAFKMLRCGEIKTLELIFGADFADQDPEETSDEYKWQKMSQEATPMLWGRVCSGDDSVEGSFSYRRLKSAEVDARGPLVTIVENSNLGGAADGAFRFKEEGKVYQIRAE